MSNMQEQACWYHGCITHIWCCCSYSYKLGLAAHHREVDLQQWMVCSLICQWWSCIGWAALSYWQGQHADELWLEIAVFSAIMFN